MHSFVVVGAKPGRTIPERSRAVLRDDRPAELTFAPSGHLHWSDGADRLHLAGWQAAEQTLGVLGHWEVRPGGATAFSGHVWLGPSAWGSGLSWAAQMADAFEREPLHEVAAALEGVGAVASLAADGSGTVTSDPLGVAVLYIAETAEMTVVGTRAALVARVVSGEAGRPGRDVEGAGWLAYASNLQTDRTTFEGVRTVPQGSVVRFGADRPARVETWSAMPWLDGPDLADAAALEDAVDESIAHLRSLARLAATLPSWMTTLELTGGRDSRLILSLLLAEDLARDVVCITWGEPDLPDVVVATQIADHFGLEHRASTRPGAGHPPTATSAGSASPVAGAASTAPDRPADAAVADPGVAERSASERVEADLRHHVWLTSGAQSIWDLGGRGRQRPSPGVALTGQFGELLRTNYAGTDGIQSVADLHAYVRAGRFGFDAAGLLRPDARRHYDQLVHDQLDALLPVGGTAQDAVDGYNQAARLRRWFGTGHENDRRNRMFPLYSMPATRTAFGMGSARRRSEVVPFEVMRRCCDDLARMPFSGAAWPVDATASVADPSAYPTAPMASPWRPPASPTLRSRLGRWRTGLGRSAGHPRRPTPMTTAGEVARMRDIERKIPVLHDLVDLPPSHPVFDLVDRKALHRSIDALADLPFLARRSVHDAVTTAVWLSGGDARDPAGQG